MDGENLAINNEIPTKNIGKLTLAIEINTGLWINHNGQFKKPTTDHETLTMDNGKTTKVKWKTNNGQMYANSGQGKKITQSVDTQSPLIH